MDAINQEFGNQQELDARIAAARLQQYLSLSPVAQQALHQLRGRGVTPAALNRVSGDLAHEANLAAADAATARGPGVMMGGRLFQRDALTPAQAWERRVAGIPFEAPEGAAPGAPLMPGAPRGHEAAAGREGWGPGFAGQPGMTPPGARALTPDQALAASPTLQPFQPLLDTARRMAAREKASAQADATRAAMPAMGRDAEGNLYPTAGHYGEFSATMGQLGLPSSSIGARGPVNIQDALMAAAERMKAGSLAPDVPIAEVQDVRSRQALAAAAAARQREDEAAAAARQREDEAASVTRKHELELKRMETQGRVQAEEAKGRASSAGSRAAAADEHYQLSQALASVPFNAANANPELSPEIIVNGKKMSVAAALSRLNALEDQHPGLTSSREDARSQDVADALLEGRPPGAPVPGPAPSLPAPYRQQLAAVRQRGPAAVQQARAAIEASDASPAQKAAALAVLEGRS